MTNFQPHQNGALFSPDEIRVLMAAEFDRSVRFKTPLAILRIAVDRLGYLHDLYGEESKNEILVAVNGLLRQKTRASDLLGFPFGNQIIAAVPHIQKVHAEQLAGRLISGARGLSFDADGRTLRITTSVGLAHSETAYESFEAMFDGATEALDQALAGGGDRSKLHVPKKPEPPAPTPSAAPATGLGALPKDMPLGDNLLAETLRRALTGEIPTEQARMLLSHIMGDLEDRYSDNENDERTEMLERRVSKLGSMLENTEAQLRQLLASGGLDAGVASKFKSVQGLDSGDSHVEQKRDLLKAIFDANLRMRKMQEGGTR
jgi:diguanylate cyclase (GGDEF)-like protein